MEVLNKITSLKSELDSLRPLDKDREAAIMQKLRLDWNYHSNHIEGNSLTFGETKALILFGITAAGKPLKDHFEMTGHDEAVKWVEDVVKENRTLTENFIRELHKLILKEPYEMPTITPDGIPAKRIIHIGKYKSSPNHVLTPTGEIFRFATPEETPAMMHDLIEWYRSKESDPETHPLLLAAEFHYRFIRIHPFDDGNGRTARILMNFILMKQGYPPVVVKTEDKANYIAALQQSDAGIITPFIEYIGENLAHSLEIMLRGAKGENIDEPDDVDKEIALIKQKLKPYKDSLIPIFDDNDNPIQNEKSQKAIESVYSNSLKILLEGFLLQCGKFSQLYIDSKFSFWFKDVEKSSTMQLVDSEVEDYHSAILKEITDSDFTLDKLSFNFDFFQFRSKMSFNFESGIDIEFLIDSFSVKTKNSQIELSKQYFHNLSEIEIESIIRSETKAHTDFINQQIENAQQKHE